MLIVGDNLKHLILQHGMCNDEKAFDQNSITLSLDRQLISIKSPSVSDELTYGHHIPNSWLNRFMMEDSGYVLPARGYVLGCSREEIKIPSGYFGLLQTKGSLARLFVMVHCGDGQVDAGYSGRITFELVNLAGLNIRLLPLQPIADLFIFRASTRSVPLYSGRYQSAKGPTIQLPADETSSSSGSFKKKGKNK